MKYLLILMMLPLISVAQDSPVDIPLKGSDSTHHSIIISNLPKVKDTTWGVFVIYPHPKKKSLLVGVYGYQLVKVSSEPGGLGAEMVVKFLAPNGKPILRGWLRKGKILTFVEDNEIQWPY